MSVSDGARDLLMWLHSWGPAHACEYADDIGISHRTGQERASELIGAAHAYRPFRGAPLRLTRPGAMWAGRLTASCRPAPTSHPGSTARGSTSGAPSPRGAHLEPSCPK